MSPSRGGYQRLRWAARITTMGAVAAAVIYSLILCFAIGESPFDAAGMLVWGTFVLAAMFVGVAIVAWEWSLVGGLLVLATGGLALQGVLSTNYPVRFEAFSAAFCVIYMIGGVLHLIRAYLIRRHSRGD